MSDKTIDASTALPVYLIRRGQWLFASLHAPSAGPGGELLAVNCNALDVDDQLRKGFEELVFAHLARMVRQMGGDVGPVVRMKLPAGAIEKKDS